LFGFGGADEIAAVGFYLVVFGAERKTTGGNDRR